MIYIFILFSKAKCITISNDDHWSYIITERGMGSELRKEKVCLKPVDKEQSSTLQEALGELTLPKKYPEGKHLKVNPEKLKDLKYLKNYLSDDGRKWADEVLKGQETAGMIDILNIIWFVYVVFILTVNNIISLWIY